MQDDAVIDLPYLLLCQMQLGPALLVDVVRVGYDSVGPVVAAYQFYDGFRGLLYITTSTGELDRYKYGRHAKPATGSSTCCYNITPAGNH
jgi:hypothetical protein